MPVQSEPPFAVPDEPPATVPWEHLIAAQAAVMAIFSSWAFGGVLSSTQNGMLGLALLAFPLLRRHGRAGGRVSPWPLLPASCWLLFVAIAALNPSHTPAPGGGWMQRAGWIPWLPATVDVNRTVADARVWLTVLVEAAIVRATLRHASATSLLWGAIALNGFVLAAVGALFHFAGAEQMLGRFETPEPTYFFATFFYKNHWAAYGALSSMAALALAFSACPAAAAGHPAARGRVLLFGGAGLLTAVTLPLPGSRAGGMMAAGIILAFLVLFGWRWRRTAGERRAANGWPLAAGAVVALAIGAFGVNAYSSRAAIDFARTRRQIARHLDGETLDLRVLVSRDTWRMAQARPWFGWGGGCFELVFPVYQGDYLRGPDGRPQARFEFAHNDWLQLPAEFGLVGTALLLVPAALVAARGWRRADWAGRWGLAGCGLVALHGWIDFPFHNPAVLMLWTLMLVSAPGLRTAAAGRRQRPRSSFS